MDSESASAAAAASAATVAAASDASFLAQFSMLDYAIVIGIIGFSAYYLRNRKKTSNEFDASSIRTFALE